MTEGSAGMFTRTEYVEPEDATEERVAALAAVLHSMNVGCDWYEKAPYSQEPGPVHEDGKIWTVKVTEAVMACKAPHDEIARHLVVAVVNAEITDGISAALSTWDRADFLFETAEPKNEPPA